MTSWAWRKTASRWRILRCCSISVTGDRFVWGVRHPYEAGRYLLDLIATARFPAKHSAMQSLMTRLRQRESTLFVTAVAELCKEYFGDTVKVDVNKIGSTRIRHANGGDLGVISRDVVDAADGRPANGGVVAVMVVGVHKAVKGCCTLSL